MRLLHLAWPHLPLRIERQARSLPGDFVVLGGRPWDGGRVLDCTPSARERGVRRGMPLGVAHKLVPEAAFLVPDLPAYQAAMETALEALAAFTPFVEGTTDPAAGEFGSATLGIEGLERLWGDERTLLRRVAGALAPLLPGPPLAGIGGSRFAAQVAASIARERLPLLDEAVPGPAAAIWCAVPRGDAAVEAAFLAPLPVQFLSSDPETLLRLRLFGLRRIGQFARLARSAVVARFGPKGGVLHDRANGRDVRPLVPRHPPERLSAGAQLDPPVESLEPLRFVLHRLAGALCEQLAARGSGASLLRLELELERRGQPPMPALRRGSTKDESAPGRAPAPGGEPYVVTLDLPGSTSRPEPIERLLFARLEQSPPPAPVVGMTLELDRIGPAEARQLSLFVPQSARSARLDWHLAGLAVRFGRDRILRAELGDPEARLPEARVIWMPALAGLAEPGTVSARSSLPPTDRPSRSGQRSGRRT